MPNPYTNTYMPNGFDGQDQQGLNPVFQNIGAQQQFQNQQLGVENQLAQQAGQTQNGGGFNNLAMAMALRGKKDNFGNSGMSSGMTNNGVTGNIYDNAGNLISSGNAAPAAATWNQAFGGTTGMGD
jgi:hypothetical protein